MPDGTVGFQVTQGGEEMTLSVKQIMAAHLGHLKSCVDASLESKVSHLVGIVAVPTPTQSIGNALSAFELTSMVLQVVDAVVGVPVYFNDAQRHAMLDACKIAGINCLR